MESSREQSVAELTGAVASLVQLINRGQARAFDVELVAVMQLLLRSGPSSPSEIAAELEVPRSSVTGRIKTLREAGMADIRPIAGDGRSYQVDLSGTGRQEMTRLISEGLEIFTAWTSDWTEEEIGTFTRLARRLVGETWPASSGRARREPWWKDAGDESGPA
jgi:DNA-binding MarR family transcriptional regulator